MTAQVAILSAQGVALASDSAVTVTGGRERRYYTSAEKIFEIPGVPLAVMHSGCAQLAGIPWQILIERWGRDREPLEQPSLAEYAGEFLDWLSRQEHFTNSATQIDLLRWMFRDYMLYLRNRVRTALSNLEIPLGPGYLINPSESHIVDELVADAERALEGRAAFTGLPENPSLLHDRELVAGLTADLDWVFDDTPRTQLMTDTALRIASLLALREEPFDRDATLVFAGYADGDFFPSSWEGTVSGVLFDVARVRDTSETRINGANHVSINPYGMAEAIQMFLRGTSPIYRATAHRALDQLAGQQGEDEDSERLAQAHDLLEERFDSIEWDDFLTPTLDVVSALPLAELTRIADSLVGLASLRQTISGESSVGGAVDVARISKTSGFCWVRRKA